MTRKGTWFKEELVKMVDFKAYFYVTGNIPAKREKVIHWREGTLHEPIQLRPEKIYIESTRVILWGGSGAREHGGEGGVVRCKY